MRSDRLVLVQKSDGIATVALNRPEKRNAIDSEMCKSLRGAFDDLEADQDIRAIVLTGNGPVFCAGMDLKSFTHGGAEDILFGDFGFAGFVKRRRKKPVIAAVEGAALAGGFEIMLACDMVVAGEGAVFGLPEVRLGLVAGGGGAIRLSQRVPRVLANELLLSGRSFPAKEMHKWGLINRIVPDGSARDTSVALALEIAENAPLGIAASIALSDAVSRANEVDLWKLNDNCLKELANSQDVAEGITAFFDRRAPKWSGK